MSAKKTKKTPTRRRTKVVVHSVEVIPLDEEGQALAAKAFAALHEFEKRKKYRLKPG